MPKPPQISAETPQISLGTIKFLRFPDDLRPQISMEILVPQILMCFLADFVVSKSQRDCMVGHDFRGSFERDADLCKLIDLCEKPLTPLKYAKLLYDFGNACHPDDWEYISGCFMSSLKSNDDFQDFYTKFKHMYEEICECD